MSEELTWMFCFKLLWVLFPTPLLLKKMPFYWTWYDRSIGMFCFLIIWIKTYDLHRSIGRPNFEELVKICALHARQMLPQESFDEQYRNTFRCSHTETIQSTCTSADKSRWLRIKTEFFYRRILVSFLEDLYQAIKDLLLPN